MPEYLVRVKGKLQLLEKSSSRSRQANSKKIQENLPINYPLEFRYPLDTKIGWFNPANLAELGSIRLPFYVGVRHSEFDKKIKLFLAVEALLFAPAVEEVTIRSF